MRQPFLKCNVSCISYIIKNGEHGIRTHVASIRRKPHFECGTFDLSDNSPMKYISDVFPTSPSIQNLHTFFKSLILWILKNYIIMVAVHMINAKNVKTKYRRKRA